MLPEVGAQLMSMEMGFLCFSSALKSLFRSLWGVGHKERTKWVSFYSTLLSPLHPNIRHHCLTHSMSHKTIWAKVTTGLPWWSSG